MPKLIQVNQIVEDTFQSVNTPEALRQALTEPKSQHFLFTLAYWMGLDANQKSALSQLHRVGLQIENTTEPQTLAQELSAFSLIAIPFPVFTDGRGYSLARILREQYHFNGELRAVGDVLPDQLFYMKRCGFDAYQLRADKNIEEALCSLNDFSVSYQAAVDEPLPHFKRQLSC